MRIGFENVKLYPLPNEFGTRVNVVPQFVAPTWIAGWEIGNVIRAKSKAFIRGDIPLTSNVRVRFILVDGKMVAVGGRSEVLIIRREGTPGRSEILLNPLRDRGLSSADHESDLDTNVRFLELFARLAITNGELGDELLRNYLLFLSGLMSESEFRRKLRSIEEKSFLGRNIEISA